jgi:hypothetical protein
MHKTNQTYRVKMHKNSRTAIWKSKIYLGPGLYPRTTTYKGGLREKLLDPVLKTRRRAWCRTYNPRKYF